jgi:hypothetical protein
MRQDVAYLLIFALIVALGWASVHAYINRGSRRQRRLKEREAAAYAKRMAERAKRGE